MAVTQDPRYGTNRWSAGSDPWPARAGWNALLDLLTTKAAIFAEGAFSARPAFSAAKKGTFYWATDQNRLYYQSATAWTEVSPVGGGGIPKAVKDGADGAEGVSRIGARADHIHPEPAWVGPFGLGAPWVQYGGAQVYTRVLGRMAQATGAVRYPGGIGANSVVLTPNSHPELVPPAYATRELWIPCGQGWNNTATSSFVPDGVGALGIMSNGTMRLKRGPHDGSVVDVFILDGATWRVD
jgi:hypothetical protein